MAEKYYKVVQDCDTFVFHLVAIREMEKTVCGSSLLDGWQYRGKRKPHEITKKFCQKCRESIFEKGR